MTAPLYNLQAWKEAVGIGDVHFPTTPEIDGLKSDRFAVPPTEYKALGYNNFPGFGPGKFSPKENPRAAVESAQARSVLDLARTLQADVRMGGSLFFSRADQGIVSKPTYDVLGAQVAAVHVIEFDLILSENHDLNATVCSHPVQDGSAITDHIQPEATKAQVQVLVTEYSLKDAGYDVGGKFQYTGTGRPDRAKGGAFVPGMSRAKAAWETFKAIMQASVPVKIVTVLDVYENVAISHVGAPRDGGTGEAMIFDVEFTQIRTVSLKTAKLSAASAPHLPTKTSAPTASVTKKRKAAPKKRIASVCGDSATAQRTGKKTVVMPIGTATVAQNYLNAVMAPL